VTFSSELRRELARHGIDPRRARRIVAELEDHRACDPDAELGSPELIASRFAAELRVVETRRATYGGFLALALTAIAIVAATMAISAAGGWPTVGGVSEWLIMTSGLVVVVAGQVAFVAGVLAVWLLLSDGDELALVQRRMRVALAAAAAAAAGELVQVISLRSHLPVWWFALSVGVTAASAAGLTAAVVVLRRAGGLTRDRSFVTGGVPQWFVLTTGAAVVGVMTVATAHLERSWIEGLIRGGFEAVAFAGGFLALGRFVGLRASIRHETVPTLRQ
jgi:hypothetical protein